MMADHPASGLGPFWPTVTANVWLPQDPSAHCCQVPLVGLAPSQVSPKAPIVDPSAVMVKLKPVPAAGVQLQTMRQGALVAKLDKDCGALPE